MLELKSVANPVRKQLIFSLSRDAFLRESMFHGITCWTWLYFKLHLVGSFISRAKQNGPICVPSTWQINVWKDLQIWKLPGNWLSTPSSHWNGSLLLILTWKPRLKLSILFDIRVDYIIFANGAFSRKWTSALSSLSCSKYLLILVSSSLSATFLHAGSLQPLFWHNA